ncbi:MAG: DUF488 domain-containing protein [Candidatus Micrarchaeia archaeon]
MIVGIKRIYDKADIIDGKRVLVDALWPRGVKKSTANIDLWFKEIAPSTELRKWFAHDPSKWEEFEKRYIEELDKNEYVAKLLELVKNNDVTLVYASRDTEHNNAIVLAGYIKRKLEAK